MSNKGVIYIVCSSNRHFDEAIRFISSLLEHNQGTNITIITDMRREPSVDVNIREFHSPVYHPLKEKCRMMGESPYDKTLFLDTDTRMFGDVSPIFDYLDNYDLAVANAPDVDRDKERFSEEFFVDYKIPNIYNTGVVGFNNNDKVDKFFNLWWDRFKGVPSKKVSTAHGDQIYFNNILNDDNTDTSYLDIKELDNKKYNARGVLIPYLHKDDLLDEVIIYHGHQDIDDLL